MKRFIFAALVAVMFWGGTSQGVEAQNFKNFTVLQEISAAYVIPYDSTSQRLTGSLNTGARVLRVVCTTACFVELGATPTATTSSIFLPANVPEYFVAPTAQENQAGGGKIAVIRLTTTGTLYVQEFN